MLHWSRISRSTGTGRRIAIGPKVASTAFFALLPLAAAQTPGGAQDPATAQAPAAAPGGGDSEAVKAPESPADDADVTPPSDGAAEDSTGAAAAGSEASDAASSADAEVGEAQNAEASEATAAESSAASEEKPEEKPEATPEEKKEKAVKAAKAVSSQKVRPAEADEKFETPEKAAEALKATTILVPYKPWEELGDTTYDWVQMTSGEWLKGDIKGLREETLLFDSDEFDLQELDWADIAVLHSTRDHIYVFADQTVVVGPAELSKGKIVVQSEDGLVKRQAKNVMSVVREGDKEIQHWRFKLSLGATLRRGNTQTADYTAFSRLRREDALNRFTLEYNGAFGLVKEQRNTNKHRGTAEWAFFLSPRFYLVPVLGEVLRDEFQNIDFRWIGAAGAGVHIIDSSKLKLDFQLAAGYAQSFFISSIGTQANPKQGFLTIPSLYFDWDITDDVELEASWYSALFIPKTEYTFHRGTARLSIDITDAIDVDFSATYDRIESPTPRDDGTIPYKDDLAMTAGIGIDLD